MFDAAEDMQSDDRWLKRLNAQLSGFARGDRESKTSKTADFVNHSQKIAVELKREKGENLDRADGNLLILSNRIEKYIEGANKKFENYPGYRTLLLTELKTSTWSAEVIMNGIPQLHFVNGQHVGTSTKNKNLFLKMRSIGAMVFWPASGNLTPKAYYFDNLVADQACKISLEYARSILGSPLELLRRF